MKKHYPTLVIVFVLLAAIGGAGYLFISTSKISENKQNTKTTQKAYKNINSEELRSYLDENRDIYLLDVHIPEQTHIEKTDDFIPFNEIEKYQSKLPEDKDTEIVVYCRSGNMSETASETLNNLGYKNVKNLEGGLNAWKARGYE